jgi:hypothetical protein
MKAPSAPRRLVGAPQVLHAADKRRSRAARDPGRGSGSRGAPRADRGPDSPSTCTGGSRSKSALIFPAARDRLQLARLLWAALTAWAPGSARGLRFGSAPLRRRQASGAHLVSSAVNSLQKSLSVGVGGCSGRCGASRAGRVASTRRRSARPNRRSDQGTRPSEARSGRGTRPRAG